MNKKEKIESAEKRIAELRKLIKEWTKFKRTYPSYKKDLELPSSSVSQDEVQKWLES